MLQFGNLQLPPVVNEKGIQMEKYFPRYVIHFLKNYHTQADLATHDFMEKKHVSVAQMCDECLSGYYSVSFEAARKTNISLLFLLNKKPGNNDTEIQKMSSASSPNLKVIKTYFYNGLELNFFCILQISNEAQ